ncbi:MAG TPA: hypothetical protein VFV30_08930 [Novosphingobium sp.]|nr:hypothetical protein [Novosphingobium sp.]
MTKPVSEARIAAETARLMGLLPAHIRAVDAESGHALEALMGVLARGVAEIDGEIDALYDGLFAETASPASLDEIAALIGAIPLRPLPEGAGHNSRAYVANTLRYRRGKGTARVLEELAADVGGFGAVAVEYFMRLARTAHLADLRPERPATARLVPGETAARAGSGFDRLPRLVDVRSIARAGGAHHVPHVGVHVVRPLAPAYPAPSDLAALTETEVAGVPIAAPWKPGGTAQAGYFQLAAVPGAPLRLFNPDRRSQDGADRMVEQDLADRLTRLPLYQELEELRHAALEQREAQLTPIRWFNPQGEPFAVLLGRRQGGKLLFDRVPPERICIANLEDPPVPAGARPPAQRAHRWVAGSPSGATDKTGNSPVTCAFDPVTGRLILADPLPGLPVEAVRVAHAYGLGREIGAGPFDRNDPDVPFAILAAPGIQTDVWLVGPRDLPLPAGVNQAASLADAVAAWNGLAGPNRRGYIVLTSCDRSGGSAPITVKVPGGSELHILSSRFEDPQVRPGVDPDPALRGYLVRKGRSFVVEVPLIADTQISPALGGRLVLDGLSLTAGLELRAGAVSDLLIRFCSLRAPGGAALSTTAPFRGAAVTIDRSLTGPLRLHASGATATGTLAVRDSVVAADGAAGRAIDSFQLETRLDNVTVLGPVRCKELEATNALLRDPVTVTRTQAGCVRYSWIAPGSSVPRTFRCQPQMALAAAAAAKGAPLGPSEREAIELGLAPQLLDLSLDEPTVAMLAAHSPRAIISGGEGESEMGAFSPGALGLRQANMERLFEDYIPFGNEAGLIDDTRSSAVAFRRNRP